MTIISVVITMSIMISGIATI